MTHVKKNAPSREPTVDDFRLNKMQREFHDRYLDGETQGVARASALASGYSDTTSKARSSEWIPPVGCSSELARRLAPLPQAIFWTQYHRLKIKNAARAKAETKIIDLESKKIVVTREYVESVMLEIVERCMGHDVRDKRGRDLAGRLVDESKVEIKNFVDKADYDGLHGLIERLFKSYCRKHNVFRPTQAKEAAKLLGIEIGLFSRVLKKPVDTPVDQMDLQQLMAERDKLASEYDGLTKVIVKKGGKDGKRPN